jgi:hypothetical protein
VPAFLARYWTGLVAGLAAAAYAICVFGFGLVYRPLHNDEGVTLRVASNDSLRGVLDLAVNYRHGPPLHYLLVHLSLLWREDVLGLRFPSAVLGLAAVLLAYGFGRELLGRAGGALISVVIAVSPAVVHLGQFARGYTAMLAGCFLSLWLLLVLLRTRQARWIAPYAVSALLLAAAHPFGLFALFSELILLVVLGAGPSLRRRDRRDLAVFGGAVVVGVVALLALRQVYAPLENKYGVGSGGAVVHPFSSEVWRPLWEAWSGTTRPGWWVVLAAVTVAGLIVMLRRDHRAAIVCGVWLLQPLLSLSVLTAQSNDFAPERHLSFLLPAYAACIAAAVLELARRVGRRGPLVAGITLVVLLAPGAVSIVRDVGNFTPDLRDASLYLGQKMGPNDVLLSTGGKSEAGVAARLYGAYAVLEAPGDSSLAHWDELDGAIECVLVDKLSQRPTPTGAWVLLRPSNPPAAAEALTDHGASDVQVFGDFLVARLPLPGGDVQSALRQGALGFRAARRAGGHDSDLGVLSQEYRRAAIINASGGCAPTG